MCLQDGAQIFPEEKEFQQNSFAVTRLRGVYQPGNLRGTLMRPIKIEVAIANDKRRIDCYQARGSVAYSHDRFRRETV